MTFNEFLMKTLWILYDNQWISRILKGKAKESKWEPMICYWSPKDFLSQGNQNKPKGKPKEIQRNSRGSLKKFKGPRGIQRKAKENLRGVWRKSKANLYEIRKNQKGNPKELQRKSEGIPKEIKMKGTGCPWKAARNNASNRRVW